MAKTSRPDRRSFNGEDSRRAIGETTGAGAHGTAASCKDTVARIGDFLAGALSGRDLDAFGTHLSGCPDCAAFLRTYTKTIETYRSVLWLLSTNDRPRNLEPRALDDRCLDA